MTPSVPYQTLLDKYSNACSVFIALMASDAAILGAFAVRESYYDEGLRTRAIIDLVDKICMAVAVLLFVLMHLFFHWRSVGSHWKCRRIAEAHALVAEEAVTVTRYPKLAAEKFKVLTKVATMAIRSNQVAPNGE